MQRIITTPQIISQARPSAKVIPLKKRGTASNRADIDAPEPKTKRKFMFTDQALRKLKLPPKGDQVPYYDTVQTGLSILVGYGGTKAFRSTYYVKGDPKAHTRTIGRLGENSLELGENASTRTARERVRLDRAMANQGLDPEVEEAKAHKVAKANEFTVQQAIDRFVEEHCKVSQRSWTQTKSTLLRACRPWLNKPVNSITRTDCRERLKEIVASGAAKNKKMHATGRQSLAWIKTLWKWMAGQELLEHDTMHPVTMTFQKPSRDRVYTDKEIRSIWRAAGKLPVEEQVYVRLMILLAPRKTALAGMKWADLDKDLNLWTVPDYYVKKRKLAPKRTYRVPLPKLAKQVLSKLKRGKPDERVMPSLRIQLVGERPMYDPVSLQRALKRWGAPSDFILHAVRHTVTSWLEEQGHEPWSRGLVMNHAEQGVTANYSHSPSMRRKLENLEQWAAWVQKIVA